MKLAEADDYYPNWRAKTTNSFERFLDHALASQQITTPYLPYDFANQLSDSDWPPLAGEIVRGNLTESANGINEFHSRINHLDAWARVIAEMNEEDAWDTTHFLVSPIAHFCLLQPYALKERLVHAATQIIHQGNIKCFDDYQDSLPTDPVDISNPKWPSGREKFNALLQISKKKWLTWEALGKSLTKLNDRQFEQQTLRYRTKANHAIPPHFEIGLGPFVTRYLSTDYVLPEAQPKAPRVTYGFGGTPPLKISEIVSICATEHANAVDCHQRLEAVVREILEKIKSA